MSDIAIKVDNLGKKYIIGHQKEGDLRGSFGQKIKKIFGTSHSQTQEEFWALQDISFEVKKGEALGVIGRNGAGKSTLLKILSRITDPSTGRFEMQGRVSSLLEVGTGFHSELSGRENIYLNGTILGMKRREIKKKFAEIVAFSGVEKFIDTPVKHYSSGMKVRLAFSVAAHLEPEILIVDEVLAVGDAEFQKKCLGKMDEVSKNEGRTVLFVSHNMGAVKNLCEKGILLKDGRILKTGSIDHVISDYLGESKRNNSSSLIDRAYIGTGKMKFSGLDILVNGNHPPINSDIIQVPAGASIKFNCSLLSYMFTKNQNIFIAISIFDQYGVRVATLDNLYTNKPFEIRGAELHVYCNVDELSLTTGIYYLDLWCSDGYETFQKIEQAVFFEIVDIDSLKTGKTHSSAKHGYFYFKQNWDVV